MTNLKPYITFKSHTESYQQILRLSLGLVCIMWSKKCMRKLACTLKEQP